MTEIGSIGVRDCVIHVVGEAMDESANVGLSVIKSVYWVSGIVSETLSFNNKSSRINGIFNHRRAKARININNDIIK